MVNMRLNWGPILFLVFYHLALAITFPLYLYFYSPSWILWVTSFVLFFLGGLSITAGYHRLLSHRAFKTNPVIEAIALFFASSTFQGSALRWCYDHRMHHAFVDTDKDPYNIKRGFWYAHCLWLIKKPNKIDAKVVPDLVQDRMIALQHRYKELAMTGSNLILWLLIGYATGDYWGAFVIGTLFRIFCLHHCTWFINSLAHTWGDKPFSQEHTAVNNFIISFLTFGEGYHNYHHTYANDYRNGVRWWQFDPTKWLIWSLSRLKLASHLKQVDSWTIQKKIVLENRELLLNRITNMWYLRKEELEKSIQHLSDKLLEQLSQFYELKKQLQSVPRENRLALKRELRQLKKNLKANWKAYSRLSRIIFNLKPIPA